MKVAIAGYGAEGRSNYHYFAAQGHDLTIVDERSSVEDLPDNAKTLLGSEVFSQLQGFDMVIRTAGLAPRKIHTDGRIWSATNEFFEKCPATIIGVTGSKGKGTTASLIASILREAGKTVHLVGNIGVPALDTLSEISPDDLVVYELSSFQLWDARFSPHVAVVLMIEPEHLDVHASVEEYVSAKANIARFQGENDTVVYKRANHYAASIAQLSPGVHVGYQADETAHVVGGVFYYGEQKICSTDSLRLPGIHNQDNACAAINAVWSWTQDSEVIRHGLEGFSGLPHRLKLIREVSGVAYYDDSIATTPGSAIAALASFSQPKVLILGGSSKGADFTELAAAVKDSNTKAAILVGDEAPHIERSLQESGFESVYNLGSDITMAQIVQHAQQVSAEGDVVILSPSCASFGMFKNYVDRGEQFIAAVNELTDLPA